MKNNNNLPWEENTTMMKGNALIFIGALLIIIGVIVAASWLRHRRVSNPKNDPVYTDNAAPGGGKNLEDDGAGDFQPAMPMPEQHDYSMISAEELLEKGTAPTLEQLLALNVACVYNANGEKIDLFNVGDGYTYTPNILAEIPEDVVYVDSICSGRYVSLYNSEIHTDNIYIVFDNGVTSHVTHGSYMQLNVYDTLVDDNGTFVNTASLPTDTRAIHETD